MSEGWQKDVAAAREMVHALCLPRGSEGAREWIMSIPARPDHDPDLVITQGIRAAELEIERLAAELARVKAESLRVVKVGGACKLSELEYLNISNHTNTCTVENVDWRIYAAERRIDDRGHRYLMPVSDEWPPIPFGPDTTVQPVRLERWEEEG